MVQCRFQPGKAAQPFGLREISGPDQLRISGRTAFTRHAAPHPVADVLQPAPDLPARETHRGDGAFAALYRCAGEINPYFPALKPPSMMNSAPVTNADSSLAKYSAAAAISSGLPMRPTACVADISCRALSGSGYSASRAATNGVSTRPGQMQFTRMPSLAWSSAMLLVRPATANLVVQYATRSRTPTTAPMEARLMMVPDLRSSMSGRKTLVTL